MVVYMIDVLDFTQKTKKKCKRKEFKKIAVASVDKAKNKGPQTHYL